MVPDPVALANLIQRLERLQGRVLPDGTKITYLGDGRNPGVTSLELLAFLKPLLKTIDAQEDPAHNTDIATKD